MRKARYLFAKHEAVAADVGGADFQQIVETARDHMAFLHLGNAAHSSIEFAQGIFPRVRQLHFGEGDMVQPHFCRIQDSMKALDHAGIDQSAHPNLARRLGETDTLGERNETIAAKYEKNFPKLELVTIDDPQFGGWSKVHKRHFADGALFGNSRQLLIQATAIGAVLVYSGVVSFVILKVISLVTPLRARAEDETTGLDLSLHGEEAYLHEG